jgi:hypothetical protein
MNEKKWQRISRGIAAAMILSEAWRLAMVWQSREVLGLSDLRFGLCNQICLVTPWLVLFDRRRTYAYFDVLSAIGGIGVWAAILFGDFNGGLSPAQALQSDLSHALMAALPVALILSGEDTQEAAQWWKPFAGMAVVLAVAFTMGNLLNADYFFTRSADGLFCLSSMAFPWYWTILMPVLAGLIAAVKALMIWGDYLLHRRAVNCGKGIYDE